MFKSNREILIGYGMSDNSSLWKTNELDGVMICNRHVMRTAGKILQKCSGEAAGSTVTLKFVDEETKKRVTLLFHLKPGNRGGKKMITRRDKKTGQYVPRMSFAKALSRAFSDIAKFFEGDKVLVTLSPEK